MTGKQFRDQVIIPYELLLNLNGGTSFCYSVFYEYLLKNALLSSLPNVHEYKMSRFCKFVSLKSPHFLGNQLTNYLTIPVIENENCRLGGKRIRKLLQHRERI
jgi:hypothetical protein